MNAQNNDITVIVLTTNINKCVLSVKEAATRIVVVDSGSTIKICDITKEA